MEGWSLVDLRRDILDPTICEGVITGRSWRFEGEAGSGL